MSEELHRFIINRIKTLESQNKIINIQLDDGEYSNEKKELWERRIVIKNIIEELKVLIKIFCVKI